MKSGAHLSVGDLVRVRSKAEVLRTLDKHGRLEGLPFMPEMFEYCERTFKVSKRAHKTCDFVTRTGIRKLDNCVHLADLRCDGAAHGGCEAGCLLFWKEAWLERVDSPNSLTTRSGPSSGTADRSSCSEADVVASTRVADDQGSEPRYVCQATLLPDYTNPLSPFDVRQYITDYRSGNVRSIWSMIPPILYRVLDNVINLGIGWGEPLRRIYEWVYGQLYPGRRGLVPEGMKTPVAVLDLQAGELVRVRSHRAILETLDQRCMNRGMVFSPEMVPYCGGTYRVRGRVTRLIDERNGKMLTMKAGAVLLDGVVCQARYNSGTLFCPRATFPYWRELWLERVDSDAPVPE
jgi:hypothetical protein